jgi:glutamate racemase
VIVLGCTHFVFIKHHIHDYFKGSMTIIDTGLPVANHAKHILEKKFSFNG